MLRSVTLGVALSVLAAACALVEPPPPDGTTQQHMHVRNERGPAELTLKTRNGVLAGAVRPARLPAGSETDVTIYVPPGVWWIDVDGSPAIDETDFFITIDAGCEVEIVLNANGRQSSGCREE